MVNILEERLSSACTVSNITRQTVPDDLRDDSEADVGDHAVFVIVIQE